VGAGRIMQERAFLALVINHPWLVEHHFEALSALALTARDLDTALHAILNLAASGDMLDTDAVRRHLIANGLDAAVAGVLNVDVYKVASFAAPEASREDAEAAMHDVLAWQRHGHMAAELSRMRRRESEDMPH